MRRTFAAAFAILTGMAHGAMAEEPVGRYQAFVLSHGGTADRVMIIDSRDGHLWQWFEAPSIVGQPNSGAMGIRYIGKVGPDRLTNQSLYGR